MFLSNRFNRVAVALYVSVSGWKKKSKDRNVQRKQRSRCSRRDQETDVMRLTCSPAVAIQFGGSSHKRTCLLPYPYRCIRHV